MARIEPIPYDELPVPSKAIIEEGLANGMYTTPLPLQIVAYSSTALQAMHAQYEATFRRGVLEPRLVELLRLHSAEINACVPCGQSRKDDTITEDDVACLIELDPANFTTREYRALRFFEMFANDHHSIDDDTFRWLAEVFSAAEIVEILYACSQNLGGHRMMHALGVLEPTDPILTYSPEAVDATIDAAADPATV
jgi:alkylhydroperoxidase family enzyme